MRRRRGNPIVNTFSLNKKERDDCILLVPSCMSPIFPPITLQHLLYALYFGAWRKFWMRCGKRGDILAPRKQCFRLQPGSACVLRGKGMQWGTRVRENGWGMGVKGESRPTFTA